jgi:hypothetical protein
MINLSKMKNNIYSQNGEDGIIEEILKIIPDKNNWCCEFGASDGEWLSNTCNLIKNKNYSAVLIEGKIDKYNELKLKENSNIITMNRMVGYEDKDKLDNILSLTLIPKNLDLLSIDIDGDDYYVYEAINVYKPKIIIIEYNCSIATGIEFIQPKGEFIGSSISAFINLAKQKGYFLIAVTLTNLIFVDNKYIDLFSNYEKDIINLRVDNQYISYIIEGYDGKLYIKENSHVWGNRKIKNGEVICESYI